MKTIYINYLLEVWLHLALLTLLHKHKGPILKMCMFQMFQRERVLLNPGYIINFTCDHHKEWGEKLTAGNVVNKFLIMIIK